jgi:hypothetical protein
MGVSKIFIKANIDLPTKFYRCVKLHDAALMLKKRLMRHLLVGRLAKYNYILKSRLGEIQFWLFSAGCAGVDGGGGLNIKIEF